MKARNFLRIGKFDENAAFPAIKVDDWDAFDPISVPNQLQSAPKSEPMPAEILPKPEKQPHRHIQNATSIAELEKLQAIRGSKGPPKCLDNAPMTQESVNQAQNWASRRRLGLCMSTPHRTHSLLTLSTYP